MSKQKSLFDKRVEVQQKEQKKEDEFVPFEESIFFLNKKIKSIVPVEVEQPVTKEKEYVSIEDTIFARHNKIEVDDTTIRFVANTKGDYVPIEDTIFSQKKVFCEDQDNTKYIIHDDEVPFEESVFAKRKVLKPVNSEMNSEETKIKLEYLFNKYKDMYMREYISNTNRLNIIDSETWNNCCMILEKSKNTKVMSIESYDLSKRIIKNTCLSVEDVFYCYTNLNRTLIDLISELNPDIDSFELFEIIDRSYAEVIEEFKDK